MDNTNDIEFALITKLGEMDDFGLEEIDKILSNQNIHLNIQQLNFILQSLEDIGVFSRKGMSQRFFFSIPIQPLLARRFASQEFLWRKAQNYYNRELMLE